MAKQLLKALVNFLFLNVIFVSFSYLLFLGAQILGSKNPILFRQFFIIAFLIMNLSFLLGNALQFLDKKWLAKPAQENSTTKLATGSLIIGIMLMFAWLVVNLT